MKSVKCWTASTLKDILYHHHIIPIHIETYLVSTSSLSFVFLKDIFYHHHLYHSYSHRNISSIIIIICVIDGWVWGVQVYGSHVYYFYIYTYLYIYHIWYHILYLGIYLVEAYLASSSSSVSLTGGFEVSGYMSGITFGMYHI